MASSLRLSLFSLIFGFISVGIASACAVCTGGQTEEVQDAYIGITVLLSLFPIFAFGGFAYVWWRKQSKVSEEQPENKEEI